MAKTKALYIMCSVNMDIKKYAQKNKMYGKCRTLSAHGMSQIKINKFYNLCVIDCVQIDMPGVTWS